MKHLPLTLALALLPLCAFAQKTDTKKATAPTTKTTTQKPELTPEEIAAKQQAEAAQRLAEERQKRMEEMLPNTRALVFIDSLVVDKDNFLTHLRIPTEAGRYIAAEQLLPPAQASTTRTGAAAFVSSNTAYYSTPDTIGNLHISTAYNNSGEWTEPQLIDELYGYEHQDYPFLLSDGITLYFAATGRESIGGLDLFVTRYNEETRQYVRPQNLGFPYNSPANDYLLAIDEEVGLGALVTDRRQPDDKVCIYWFIAEGRRNIYDYDPDDEEAEEIVRSYAAIASIADTQEDREDAILAVRKAWDAALAAETVKTTEQYRFIISDHIVYTNLAQFVSEEALRAATQWTQAHAQLREMENEQKQLRATFVHDRNEITATAIRKLEADLPRQRAYVKQLEKDYRAAERRALSQ